MTQCSAAYSASWELFGTVLFNVIVRPEKNAHASLRKDRMGWLESDMISQDIST
jgi:hypothetical protein